MKFLHVGWYLLLPIIYFFYEIYLYYSSINGASLSGLVEPIHRMVVLEFILIIFILYRKKSYSVNNVLKKNISIFVIGLFLFILKLFLLGISEIDIDIIYLFQLLFYVSIELIPLLILRAFLKYKVIKIIYTWFSIAIILLNIGIAIYYYHTSELIEPLIFDNVNLTSIKGFFLNYSLFDITFMVICTFLLVWLFLYIVKRDKSKQILDVKVYYRNVFIFVATLFFTWKMLFYGDKLTASKIFVLYGYEKLQKDIRVDKITSNSFGVYIKAIWLYLNPIDNNHKTDSILFSVKEKEALAMLGLYLDKNIENQKNIFKRYDKIVIVAIESLSVDFINYYNSKIPREATPYLNHLLQNYFHLDNYLTSNMPTDYGWTSMLKSKLDLNKESESLFSILKKVDYKSHYIVASSRFYGLKANYYPSSFKFDKWDYKESLQVDYGKKYSGWGFHNDVVFDKAIKILNECDKKEKIIISTETADFHQPGPYCGFSDGKLPPKIKNSDKLVKSIYWIDQTLKNFIEKMKSDKIFDDNTLVIITADHNPHPGFEFKKYCLKNNYKRLAKIPLIFITKNNDFENFLDKKDNLYSQVDLLPILLSIVGIDYKTTGFFGCSIFSKKKTAYLGKYRNSLFYKKDKVELTCNLNKADEKKDCQIIKKYFYKIQGMK